MEKGERQRGVWNKARQGKKKKKKKSESGNRRNMTDGQGTQEDGDKGKITTSV